MSYKKREKVVLDELPIREQRACFIIRGTAPFVSGKMPKVTFDELLWKAQNPGASGRRKKPTFKQLYEGSKYITKNGSFGIPSTGLQRAMVDASRSADIKMTLSKQTLTVEPEEFDIDYNFGLSLITKGKPSMHVSPVPSPGKSKAAFVPRAKWEPGWEVRVIIRWNAETITANGILALLAHAGRYIGVGAGRPFSKNSCGCGWGTFEIVKAVPLDIKVRSKVQLKDRKARKTKKSAKKK